MPARKRTPKASLDGALRYKILVVEDDADARSMLKDHLGKEGFSVLLAPDANEGLRAAADSTPDLILSDVVMPETDGIAFCKRLRADRRTAGIPVVLISGTRIEEGDQVEGMEVGADDYIAKPYSARFLIAKLRAVLRRYAASSDLRDTLRAAGLELDAASRTARYRNRPVPLTRKEFDLLTLFLRKPNRVLSVPYLLETVWGYDPGEYNAPYTVQTHVSSLRRKLGPRLGRRIKSVPALGYRLDL